MPIRCAGAPVPRIPRESRPSGRWAQGAARRARALPLRPRAGPCRRLPMGRGRRRGGWRRGVRAESESACVSSYDIVLTPPKRVITVAPMPPEKSAYALARYSRTHDSMKFLESFYFQYGHASIADLGHTVMCFEGVSELAATEIEEEPLWDGQAKSSRYQDFSKRGFVTPPELAGQEACDTEA